MHYGYSGTFSFRIRAQFHHHRPSFDVVGVALGTVPVAWSAWFSRAAPDEAETASGLFLMAGAFVVTLRVPGLASEAPPNKGRAGTSQP
ncbi:protein of unknown function (plasmid) [Shinella sp. WSC3-e]|nr:hypothetical protein SHINE37_100246 [Rhizobiaceae bacterium]CAK7261797.1 protein of unknown function [Shinella sp. WSC3-e]